MFSGTSLSVRRRILSGQYLVIESEARLVHRVPLGLLLVLKDELDAAVHLI